MSECEQYTTSLVGLAGVPGEGNYFRVTLQVRHGRIVEAMCQCHPCGVAKSVARSLAKVLIERPIEGVVLSLKEWMRQTCDRIPRSKQHVVGLAIEALVRAAERMESSLDG